MNLILTGYRGTGKTSLAEHLHERLTMPVYHMDELLEERFGERIASYVERDGWDSFREEERLLVEELTAMKEIIIDTGGGVVTRDDNIQDLRRSGFVVWLQTAPELIARRIGGDSNRPSLTGAKSSVEEIIDVLNVRTPLYQSVSDITIDTGENGHDECVNRIETAWRKHLETLETS